MKMEVRIKDTWIKDLEDLDATTRCMAYDAIFGYAFNGEIPADAEISSLTREAIRGIDRQRREEGNQTNPPLPYRQTAGTLTPEDIAEDFAERNRITLDGFCKNEGLSVDDFKRMAAEVFVEWILKGWQPIWIEKGKDEYQLNHLINAIRVKKRIITNERQRNINQKGFASGRSQGAGATLAGVAREILRGVED